VVLGEEGEVVVDLGASAFGRGAWVHPSLACIEKAAPRGLSKSFRTQVRTSAAALVGQIRAAAERKVPALLAAARGARALAVGSDAVAEALATGSAELVLVATDARAAAATQGLDRAVADGRAVAWGTKLAIGGALGRDSVGVVAVIDGELAAALRSAVELAQMSAPGSDSIGRDASMEAR
jgi:predicted RNA-binding protein YlxR (DUF448 family)